jgi:hypothetical protein
MSTEIPDPSLTASSRVKRAAAITKAQLELAQELCKDVLKVQPSPELVAQVANTIATNYLASITNSK